jgi:hypothetical protein
VAEVDEDEDNVLRNERALKKRPITDLFAAVSAVDAVGNPVVAEDEEEVLYAIFQWTKEMWRGRRLGEVAVDELESLAEAERPLPAWTRRSMGPKWHEQIRRARSNFHGRWLVPRQHGVQGGLMCDPFYISM